MPAKKTTASPSKKTIYLFHGENAFASASELNMWKEEFIKKHSDTDIALFDKEEDVNEIISAILIAPFLSEKKLVIIKNSLDNFTEKDEKKIISALNKLPSSTVAVFFEEKEIKINTIYKKIREEGSVKLFKIYTEFELQNFIKENVKKLNGKIAQEAVNKLIQMTHGDAWTIEQELKKLTTYCLNREITKNDIELLVTPNLASSIFNLTDAITEKRAHNAIKIFHILASSGEGIGRIFSMIVRHFRLLMLALDLRNQNLSRNQIFQKFKAYDPKLHPFAISIYTDKCGNFSMGNLKKAYEMLLKIDTDQKTGRIKETVDNKTEIMLALEKLIIRLCR